LPEKGELGIGAGKSVFRFSHFSRRGRALPLKFFQRV